MKNLNSTYRVSVEPTVEPLDLSELKERLRILTCDFDVELTDLMVAARKQVEYDTKRKLITQTMILTMDAFPSGNAIELRQIPVQSVTSVQYVDEDRATQTFSSALYDTDLNSEPARIVLLEDESWEDTEPQYPAAVTVTFVAGYGDDATSVPVEAKLAIVEWCRMHWGSCDGDHLKYQNLVNHLAWTGIGAPI
jgi:uncharacterized phiE125 gp8 family phage protein